jgi:hypothetical protein
LLERQIRRHHQGSLFVAAADHLKQQVRRVGIVAEVPNFVDGEQRGFGVTPEAPLERAGGLLPIEIE